MTKLQSIKIFISYGRDEHAELAEKLKNDLREQGFDVWFDKDILKEGADWESYIEKSIDKLASDKENSFMLFLMTPHSVRRPDGYCLNEISKAIIKNITIIPIMVVASEPPLSICRIQWLDMQDCFPLGIRSQSYQQKFEKLLLSLKTKSFEFEEGQQTLHNLLNPIDFSVDILRHIHKFSGRKWLINRVDHWFKSSDQQSKVFWITGLPGIGKSAIASWLCENRREISAVHFCEYGNQTTGLDKLIKSLAYQLSTQLPDYSHILQTIDLQETFKTYSDPKTLFSILITKPLNKISPPDHPVTILIDALDEASNDGRNELAGLIVTEFEKTPKWLKLIITSRPDHEVMVPLQKLSPFIIDASCEENINDIKDYLQVELLPFLNEFEMSRKDEIVDVIATKSEGVFLYIKCICEELKSGTLQLKDLNNFPSSLGSVYSVFFKREFPNIENYKKNIREALSLVISSYEPIETNLLKRILHWKESDFYDFIELLGSLFVINSRGKGETITVFHLSLIDWLKDWSKSGDYCIPVAEGRLKQTEFAMMEYKKYKSDHKYILDPFVVKWLPSLIAESDNPMDVLNVLSDNEYVKLKIKLGFTEVLMNDFQKVFMLAHRSHNFDIFHTVLISVIKVHTEISNINLETLKNGFNKSDVNYFSSSLDITVNISLQDMYLTYIIKLYEILFVKKKEFDGKNQYIHKILTEIDKFSVKYPDFNWAKFLPLSLIKRIGYKLEELNIDCTTVLKGAKPYNHLILGIEDEYQYESIENADYIPSLLTEIAVQFYQNGLIEKASQIANRLDDSGKKYCSDEFLRLNRNQNEIEPGVYKKAKDNKLRISDTLFSGTVLALLGSAFRVFVLKPLYFSNLLIDVMLKYIVKIGTALKKGTNRIILTVHHLDKEQIENFLYYAKPPFVMIHLRTGFRRRAFKIKRRMNEIMNVMYEERENIPEVLYPLSISRGNKIDLDFEKCVKNINIYSPPEMEKHLHNLVGRIEKTFTQIEAMFIYSKYIVTFDKLGFKQYQEILLDKIAEVVENPNSLFEREHTNYHLIDLLVKINGYDEKLPGLLTNYFKIEKPLDNKFIKMLALGDISFVSKNVRRLKILQRDVYNSIEDLPWKEGIGIGDNDSFNVKTPLNWSLVFPQLSVDGLFGIRAPEETYNSLRFFIEHYYAVVSPNAEYYFPQFSGQSGPDLGLEGAGINELNNILYSEVYHKKRKEIDKRLADFRNVPLKEIKLFDLTGLIAILELRMISKDAVKKSQSDPWIKSIEKFLNKRKAPDDVVFELYVKGNIEKSIKLLLKMRDESESAYLSELVILVTNYLDYHNLNNWIEVLIDSLIAENACYLTINLFGALLDRDRFDLASLILEKVGDRIEIFDVELLMSGKEIDSKQINKYYGYLAFHFANRNQFDDAIKNIHLIEDHIERDKWLMKISIIAAKANRMEIALKGLKSVKPGNKYALLLWALSECKRELGFIEEANTLLKDAFVCAKKMKSDDTKKLIIIGTISKFYKSNTLLALEGIDILYGEKMVSNHEINCFLKEMLNRLISKKNYSLAFEIFKKYPDSLDELTSAMKSLPITKILEIVSDEIGDPFLISGLLQKSIRLMFRNIDNIDYSLNEVSSIVIKDVEILYEILYRYAAYIAFCSDYNYQSKRKILEEINEVIKIDDWIKEIKN
jgi:hypothetical protein